MATAAAASTKPPRSYKWDMGCRPRTETRFRSARRLSSHTTRAVLVDPPPELDLKHAVVLEMATSVTRPLSARIAADEESTSQGALDTGGRTALDFVRSNFATRAALAGGPEPASTVENTSEFHVFEGRDISSFPLWRVKAPGFCGRLFFVGPEVSMFPVNVFVLETKNSESQTYGTSSESGSSADAATLILTQIRGEMEGTPSTIVNLVNKWYRAEKTKTTVCVDLEKKTITTSLELRVVLEVPTPFRWVDKRKIEVGMREAFEPQTDEAMGKVCDEVAAAFVEWIEAGTGG